MNQEIKKVFLVEDDSAIVDIYQIVMKKAHFAVQVFQSGQEAIKCINEMKMEDRPDIFLLDLILPDVDGMEILKAVRQNAITKDAAVFILSNREAIEPTGPENIKADKVLIKAHVSPTQLVDLIKVQLHI